MKRSREPLEEPLAKKPSEDEPLGKPSEDEPLAKKPSEDEPLAKKPSEDEPQSEFDKFLVSRMSGHDIVEYFSAHPNIDTDFINWFEIPQKKLVKMSEYMAENRQRFKSVPSLAALSMTLAPILLYNQQTYPP